MTRPLSQPLKQPWPGKYSGLIYTLIAETPPGLCPYCDQPKPKPPASRCGPKPSTCGSAECLRARERDYQALWRQERRRRKQAGT